ARGDRLRLDRLRIAVGPRDLDPQVQHLAFRDGLRQIDDDLRLAIDIVEREKPAHTRVIHYGWVAKFWQVGVRSTVGVDTKAGG
ncbi:MAG: hypothetical protein ACYTKD_28790, partial [Planctomycetota bacterium]